ncbi:MAG: coenzyme-B sulfoethylthiotransferase subunit gamma [Methanomassiliicoccales archaeon]|jgi:methyl-coenzyme M reductase gamma subunit
MAKRKGAHIQFYPGTTKIAENNRRVTDPESKIKKLRDVSIDNVVTLLGHRRPGEAIPTVHPPIDEMTEPDCPIRKLVEPTPGAKAGDRLNYVQISDSFHFSPGSPYPRARKYTSRYRGIDVGVLTSRTVIEMRERELEQLVRDELESETYDPARTFLKGITTHGVAIRLDEDGLLFDALKRAKLDKGIGEVVYEKNQLGVPLDEPISVGRPSPEEELKDRALQYHLKNVRYSEEPEMHKSIERMWQIALMMGVDPEKARNL